MTNWEELNEYVSRPWYRYGWDSPATLVARIRNQHQPLFRLHMAWQRAKRGYGDDDLWSMNHKLAKLTVAGCRYMRENMHGYPSAFSELGEPVATATWDNILCRIEEGFQAWLDEEENWEAKLDDAMALYAIWFRDLWD